MPANNDKYTTREKIASLAHTALNSIKSLKLWASPEVEQERKKICESCPTGRRRGRKCSRCTCNIYIKIKTAGASCPDGHWGSER